MLKPPMPNVAGMTDTLEFVKNLWGSMNIPGIQVPGVPGMPGSSLSTDELDKKIADLRAVESWLNLNLGMLRGTIQALEVQRGTIATLKSMGESMAQAMGKAGNGEAMAPFAQFFSQAAQSSAPAASASAPPQKPEQAQPQQPPQQADGNPAAPGAAMPAAVAWWNLLQEQFRQAVASAMPADGAAKESKGKDGKGKEGGSPLDVSGGAPEAGAGSTGSGGGADAAPNGNPAPGRGTRSARSKADKA
jgi:hypothetical protein